MIQLIDLNDYEVVQVTDAAMWNMDAFGIFLVKKTWFNNPEVQSALDDELRASDEPLADMVALLKRYAKEGDIVIELPVTHDYSET